MRKLLFQGGLSITNSISTMKKSPRNIADSASEMIQMVLPDDTNTLGNLLGGRLMHWIDIAASITGRRHCGRTVVTASMDRLNFLNPVKLGEIVILKAAVNRVFKTSMEIGVSVFAEDPLKQQTRHTASAYLTFVALDEKGSPAAIPPIIPQTPEELRRYEEALRRRSQRLNS